LNPTLEIKVKGFVAEETRSRPERLSLDTTLLGDLGVDGDDGWRLIAAFAEEFDVDMGGFVFTKHFCNEGGANPILLFESLVRQFLAKEDLHQIAGVTPITIRDLVEAAGSRRWPE
jgi:acyl carrier protein